MKRLGLGLIATLLALASSVMVAAPASAYPDVSVTVSARTVVGGNSILIEAQVSPSVPCDWDLTFLGQSSSSSGSSISASFNTPEVDEVTNAVATATCTYDDAALQSLGKVRGLEKVAGFEPNAVSVALQTVSGSNTQTLLPVDDGDDSDDSDDSDDGDDSDDSDDSDDDNGGLPDTGGERLLWLLIGLLLVVGGATVIVTSRRDEDPEALT